MATTGKFMSEASRRIILFGGAFDPPHNGHLDMAHAAIKELHPNKLLWIPTAHAVHRKKAEADFTQRCKMIRLMIDQEPSFELCTIENKRDKKSYFIDTLNLLINQEGPAQFYLLIGQDQLDQFTTWHEWRTIIAKSTLVVMPRKNCTTTSLPNTNLLMLKADTIDICSTQIKRNIDSLGLSAAVRGFICDQKLYSIDKFKLK